MCGLGWGPRSRIRGPMAKLKVDEALLRAKSRERRGEMGEARQLYEAILHAYPGNRRARERLTRLAAAREAQPPAARMEALAALCRQGRHAEAAEEARALLAAFPASFLVWNAL